MLNIYVSICSQSFKIIGDFSTSATFIEGIEIYSAYIKTSIEVEPDTLSICRGSTPVEL